MGFLRYANQVMILVNNPVGGATDSILLRLWGRSEENNDTDTWYPLGTASSGGSPVTNLTKGTLNSGGAITVNAAPQNSASHTEMLLSMAGLRFLYMEIVAVTVTTGTWDCAVSARAPGNEGLGQSR